MTRLTRLPVLAARGAQRGAVLLLTLIVMVVMLIGSVALVRSFDTSLLTAGSIAFKRDLINEGELVVPTVLAAFNTSEPGALLNSQERRQGDVLALNYSASLLPHNAQGIPEVLVNGRGFGTNVINGSDGVTIRYVIDRMCQSGGLESVLGPARCVTVPFPGPRGGNSFQLQRAEDKAGTGERGAAPVQVVFRVTMRVDGPRNTQAFLQTTFAQ